MGNQIVRNAFDVDYTSLTYDLTYQKPTQSIMKCSKWTKWTHTRLIWAKIWIFTKSWELAASNEELAGKKIVYC